MPLAPGIPQCHHVRTHGVRCGSPAMRGRNLCYYHIRASAKPNPRPTGMPSLEDGNAIQLGLAEIIRRVLCYDIDYKAAYCLLHAYKLALWNLKNVNRDPYYKDVVTVDPASDPQNAADMTEPLTYTQLAAREAGTEDELDDSSDARTTAGTADPENEDEMSFSDFLKSHLSDPGEVQHNEQSPQDATYLAQDVSPGTEHKKGSSPAGTAPRREVQRITIPKEIGDLIKAEAEEERFMQAAPALFNTKTG